MAPLVPRRPVARGPGRAGRGRSGGRHGGGGGGGAGGGAQRQRGDVAEGGGVGWVLGSWRWSKNHQNPPKNILEDPKRC